MERLDVSLWFGDREDPYTMRLEPVRPDQPLGPGRVAEVREDGHVLFLWAVPGEGEGDLWLSVLHFPPDDELRLGTDPVAYGEERTVDLGGARVRYVATRGG